MLSNDVNEEIDSITSQQDTEIDQIKPEFVMNYAKLIGQARYRLGKSMAEASQVKSSDTGSCRILQTRWDFV